MGIGDNEILGIKMNGLSLHIDELSIDDDQQKYDFVCNIVSTQAWNGNGKFSISILDRQLKHGIILNGWELCEGHISYDWGSSVCYFVLRDAKNAKTQDICACSQKGSMGGFDSLYMTKAIFPKAIEIMRTYDDVEEYYAVTNLEKCIADKRFLTYDTSNLDYALKLLGETIEAYKQAKEYYTKNDNAESERKLLDLRAKMEDYISYLKKKK